MCFSSSGQQASCSLQLLWVSWGFLCIGTLSTLFSRRASLYAFVDFLIPSPIDGTLHTLMDPSCLTNLLSGDTKTHLKVQKCFFTSNSKSDRWHFLLHVVFRRFQFSHRCSPMTFNYSWPTSFGGSRRVAQ